MLSSSRVWVALAVCLLALLTSSAGRAQQPAEERPATDRQRLIQEVRQELLEELRSGDLLRQQIELGIKDYFQKEQAAVAARAEAARLAAARLKNLPAGLAPAGSRLRQP